MPLPVRDSAAALVASPAERTDGTGDSGGYLFVGSGHWPKIILIFLIKDEQKIKYKSIFWKNLNLFHQY